MSRLSKKFVLSGAVTGHECEAPDYFECACKAALEMFPLSEVFNPSLLPSGLPTRAYMVVCLSRIKGWATDIIYIRNEHYEASVGSKEEKKAAVAMKLGEYEFRNGKLSELTSR